MLLGLTQRVVVTPDILERRDCLDQMWSKFLARIGFRILPVPNNLKNPISWISPFEVNGLVLTGGNDLSHVESSLTIAPERDRTEFMLLDWAVKKNIPVIGVCRGAQIMNQYMGGTLQRISDHVGCLHPLDSAHSDDFFSKYQVVNSYHDFGIFKSDLAPGFSVAAKSPDGVVEAFNHVDLPWTGIMWHPERKLGQNNNDLLLFKKIFEKDCTR